MAATKLLFGDAEVEIGRKIFANPTLDLKLKSFMEFARDRSEYSADYGQKMMRGLFNRLKISLNADKISFEKLESSSMTLYKPSEMSLNQIDEDYGLSEFTEQKLVIKNIEGDHVSILSNSKLIEEI
jgi:fatty acid synthase